MSEQDFYDAIGYELPADVPEVVEGTNNEWYKHPVGIYNGFIGKLNIKYKNGEGKNCSADEIGAVISHGTLPIWIFEFLGTVNAPTTEQVLGKDLTVPNRRTSELYYPIYISFLEKDQWRNFNAFSLLEIDGHPELKVIAPDPKNPLKKHTRIKVIPAYYGVPVRFILDNAKSKTGSVYLADPIKMLNAPRIPLDKLKDFETAIDAKVQAEQIERNSNVPNETPPDTDFDAMASDDLDGFIGGKKNKNNDDLPF